MDNEQRLFLAEVWKAYAWQAEPPDDVVNVDAWRDRVRYKAAERHLAVALLFRVQVPTLTPTQVAAALLAGYTVESAAEQEQLERVAAAARAAEARAHARLLADRELPSWDGSHRAGLADARARLEASDGRQTSEMPDLRSVDPDCGGER